MLKSLSVKDFAIIEDLTVSFNDGMTVLTGETGAGKSLIIDTISLLLGARADSDMIRYGKSSASILGVFDMNDSLKGLFESNGIKVLDTITIERTISDTSKNKVVVNGSSITLNTLKQISVALADIHIQNDTYKLFNPDLYLPMLDETIGDSLAKYMNKYSKDLMNYLEAIKDYEKVVKGQKEAIERLEFYKYEYEELSELDLYIGIDDELNETISKLSNFDKIKEALSNAYNSLDDERSSIDSIYEAAKQLEKISEYDMSYEEYNSKLLDAYYIADEVKSNIYDSLNNLDYDEDELNLAIDKMNKIEKTMDKYKKNVAELIAYLKEITIIIDMAENYDEALKEYKNKVIKAFENLKLSAESLSSYRKKKSEALIKGIIKECNDLDLPNTVFDVLFEDVNLSDPFNKSVFLETGIDKICFMISFNKGEPERPLYKVASGGEASRIMLAFKSYFSMNSSLSLMVFDEIDTGVSGSTAKKIADKMKKISQKVQVLCITHLPQVAAIGDYHKHIYKVEIENRTKTEIKDLDGNDRVEEIAKMLSGDSLSLYALEHAKELLKK